MYTTDQAAAEYLASPFNFLAKAVSTTPRPVKPCDLEPPAVKMAGLGVDPSAIMTWTVVSPSSAPTSCGYPRIRQSVSPACTVIVL